MSVELKMRVRQCVGPLRRFPVVRRGVEEGSGLHERAWGASPFAATLENERVRCERDREFALLGVAAPWGQDYPLIEVEGPSLSFGLAVHAFFL